MSVIPPSCHFVILTRRLYSENASTNYIRILHDAVCYQEEF